MFVFPISIVKIIPILLFLFAVTRTFARTLSGSALASCSVVAFYDLFLASYLKVPRAKALHFLA